MPMRNKYGRQGGVDAVLKDDMNNYRKAWEKMRVAEKINNERAVEHRLLWEKLKKINPNPTDDDLLAHAHRLEDQGLLAEAADAYQQLLTRPDQFHNAYVRGHLAELIKRVNRKQAEAKLIERRAELEEEGRLWPGRPRGLESPREVRVPGVPRSDKRVGPMMPMSPDAYRAELAAQAMEKRRQREAAKKQEEVLEQKQIAIAAAMAALEQHQRRVVGGNDRVAHANELEAQRRARQEERRRQFDEEWDHLKPLGGPGVRQSYDLEVARRRLQEDVGGAAGGYEDQYPAHHPAGIISPGYHPRPASAGAAAARERQREQERERNNAANFQRLYVPSHPYSPGGGPPPQQAWPAPPAAAAPAVAPRAGGGGAAGPLKGALKTPYSRPDVDKPRVRIDPQVVRAQQQAFIDKHRKPEAAPQQQQLPLRQRKEAVRRPDPPQVAMGYGGARGGAYYGGW